MSRITTRSVDRSWQRWAAIGLALASSGARAVEWQPPATIQAAARDFAVAALADRGQVDIETVAIDERLKLPLCADELRTIAKQPLIRGQGTVAVSCSAPQAWTLFVPIRASFRVPVLTAATGLASGQVLGASDVKVEYRASQSLPYAYLSRPEEAVGAALRRTVPPGTVLGPAMVERPRIVVRGQRVTLLAEGNGIVVKSDGVALEDGAVSQRVRVKTRSGRTVDGLVDASGEVRVGPRRLLLSASKP